MFPSLFASLEQSGYYRLEAYSEFIKSHTDYEQCEPLAFKFLFSEADPGRLGLRQSRLGLAPLH